MLNKWVIGILITAAGFTFAGMLFSIQPKAQNGIEPGAAMDIELEDGGADGAEKEHDRQAGQPMPLHAQAVFEALGTAVANGTLTEAEMAQIINDIEVASQVMNEAKMAEMAELKGMHPGNGRPNSPVMPGSNGGPKPIDRVQQPNGMDQFLQEQVEEGNISRAAIGEIMSLIQNEQKAAREAFAATQENDAPLDHDAITVMMTAAAERGLEQAVEQGLLTAELAPQFHEQMMLSMAAGKDRQPGARGQDPLINQVGGILRGAVERGILTEEEARQALGAFIKIEQAQEGK